MFDAGQLIVRATVVDVGISEVQVVPYRLCGDVRVLFQEWHLIDGVG